MWTGMVKVGRPRPSKKVRLGNNEHCGGGGRLSPGTGLPANRISSVLTTKKR